MAQLTSYAQNFEDLMLWRALGRIADGHYVDVGAQSPDTDSVSRLFYENGWRGVNIEPVAHYAEQLRRARPDEEVVQAAVAENVGVLAFFEVKGTGLSTIDPDVAAEHRRNGFEVIDALVPALTLDDIFGNLPFQHVHWLKIDVEGGEEGVLRGWRESAIRPWVVVVESTRPLTPEEDYERWEPLLISKGYAFVYFDGLNRFYVWEGMPELSASFRAGPNIFDGFSLSPHSAFCAELNVQYGKLEALLEAERATARHSIEELNAVLASERKQISELQESLQGADAAAREELASVARQCMQAQAMTIQLQEEKSLLLQDKIELQDEMIQLQNAVYAAEEQAARNAMEAEAQRAALLASLESADRKVQNLTASAAELRLEAERSARAQLAQLRVETSAELDTAYARIDELRHIAHRWWVTAEQQSAELEAMKTSRSWTMTRPLRRMRYAAGRAFAGLKIRTKTAMRPLVKAGAKAALKFPKLKRMVLPMLARSPRALERIRQVAISDGLIAVPVAFVAPLPYARTAAPRAATGRTARVLKDLKRAIDARGEG